MANDLSGTLDLLSNGPLLGNLLSLVLALALALASAGLGEIAGYLAGRTADARRAALASVVDAAEPTTVAPGRAGPPVLVLSPPVRRAPTHAGLSVEADAQRRLLREAARPTVRLADPLDAPQAWGLRTA